MKILKKKLCIQILYFFSPSSSFLNIMKDNIYSQTFIQNIPQALRSLKFSYCNCHLINMKVLINQQQQNLYIEVMILISIMMMLKLRTKKNSKKKKGETIIKGQKNGCHFFSLRKGRMLSQFVFYIIKKRNGGRGGAESVRNFTFFCQ